jgi:hypothetical protein
VLIPPFLAAISSPCAAVDLAGSSGRNSFSPHPSSLSLSGRDLMHQIHTLVIFTRFTKIRYGKRALLANQEIVVASGIPRSQNVIVVYMA